MKHIITTIILLTAILSGASSVYAKVRNVNVKQPGQISAVVKKSSLKKGDILKIKGTLNNDDLIFLRELCGRDTANKETVPLIESIDLSEVTFAPQSGSKAFMMDKYRLTSRNAIPDFFLYGTPIKSIVFPQAMDSIKTGAFAMTALTEVYIPDGVYVADNAFSGDSLLTRLRLPAMKSAIVPSRNNMKSLRSISYGDIDYIAGGAFAGLPALEEVEFHGSIGHTDGYAFSNNPNLKRITFNGPVLSTGGKQYAENCPELNELNINGLMVGWGLTDYPGCPKLNLPTLNGVVFDSSDSIFAPPTPAGSIFTRPEMEPQLEKLVDIYSRLRGSKGFMKNIARNAEQPIIELAQLAKRDDLTTMVRQIAEKYRNPDDGKSKLQILKESKPYKSAPEDSSFVKFTYKLPSDSLLTLSREHFNLDSIAGSGDDISRIKNLLYWVHDTVRHDGSSGWPNCDFNLRDLVDICKKDNRGLNCRFMAMMLTEALLAEGIPARYLTCQSKIYDEDNDCHVICVAWSRSLDKWVWVDPTFAAFVTDENGLMLHPGEVRYRLQNDMPLVLNPDANWNHQSIQTKEEYLDQYMAKNLYLIESNTMQQSQPEGRTANKNGIHVCLRPVDFEYGSNRNTTTDSELFWQRPGI